MMSHLTIGVTDPVKASADFGKHFEPGYAIVIGQKNILAPIATRIDVISAPGSSSRRGLAIRSRISGSM